MARFLFAVWPFPSHFFPMVAIAHALRERGHEVAFYSGAGARPAIEAEGFACSSFESVDERHVDDIMFSRDHYASWKLPLRLKHLLRDWLLGTVPGQVEDLNRVMAEWRPDAILSETSMWAPMLVLHETRRVPIAVFSTVAACLLPGPDAPPAGPGLPRPRSWSTRLAARVTRSAMNAFAFDFRRAIDDVRRLYGLGPLTMPFTEFTGRMPLYLVPTTPEFDYERRDLPPSVHYIGPCLWNAGAREAPPAWLDELARDRPWVHVTEGTMHMQDPILLRAAAKGLAGRPVQVIMTTGSRRDPASLALGPVSGNVRIERWVPHRFLLPRTDVVVTTGGAGTVMTALEAGVPLVVVPTEWDKPENAQRVVESGAGVRISPRRLSPARLRAAVERVLQEPSFRGNAERLAAAFARYRGPARAAELLERLGSAPSIRHIVSTNRPHVKERVS
ncbi:MAG: glycosyltransferase [Acidobacteria bacterium]|nr:MAG: glycosyltransferase [Acidobacteriota bacterium]